MFISILKLYTFHTMDNRKHFFRNYLVQHYLVCRRRLPSYMLKVSTVSGRGACKWGGGGGGEGVREKGGRPVDIEI